MAARLPISLTQGSKRGLIHSLDWTDVVITSTNSKIIFSPLVSGYGRISNVEFVHTGQEGWTDKYDPRFSLVFLDSGTSRLSSPSYVRGCSFHNGFSTAIGLFGAHRIYVEDNLIHHTIGSGKMPSANGGSQFKKREHEKSLGKIYYSTGCVRKNYTIWF